MSALTTFSMACPLCGYVFEYSAELNEIPGQVTEVLCCPDTDGCKGCGKSFVFRVWIGDDDIHLNTYKVEALDD